ncbi:hypothetical protein BST12_02590 [Mycobacterium angelicum]|uniref:Uncharacterized protein n=1 Tax=Mycobacterium angelicum TaxID=470074 RepID=A0A1X0A7R6_MYCAN|nr:hypothetical protein BST12_02590 [Mycobacterium angelicum]
MANSLPDLGAALADAGVFVPQHCSRDCAGATGQQLPQFGQQLPCDSRGDHQSGDHRQNRKRAQQPAVVGQYLPGEPQIALDLITGPLTSNQPGRR